MNCDNQRMTTCNVCHIMAPERNSSHMYYIVIYRYGPHGGMPDITFPLSRISRDHSACLCRLEVMSAEVAGQKPSTSLLEEAEIPRIAHALWKFVDVCGRLCFCMFRSGVQFLSFRMFQL